MELKINVGNPKTGHTTPLTLAEPKPLFGLKMGSTFKGEMIDKTGYEFKIVGGSDNAGFPMRRDVEGAVRRKVLLAGGVGFRSKRKGMRSRRTVAGNTVGPNTAQLNVIIVKEGKQPLVEPPQEEAPAEQV